MYSTSVRAEVIVNRPPLFFHPFMQVKAANPEVGFGGLGKIIGQMWGDLDEFEKDVRSNALI
jgi:hypothetical protein